MYFAKLWNKNITKMNSIFFIIFFSRLMENLTQKDPVWRENGKAFVESVTRLLERLLDYRNVGQVGGLFFS
jgi:hypothetical protein